MKKPKNLQEKLVYDAHNALVDFIIGWFIMTIIIYIITL